jgi:hypothetical protein
MAAIFNDPGSGCNAAGRHAGCGNEGQCAALELARPAVISWAPISA